MALELHMLGLLTQDMSKSLEFYRRLGLDFPEGSEKQTHVKVKMESGLTFFLDSDPSPWDPKYGSLHDREPVEPRDDYRTLFEFYLKTQDAVEAKYAELTGSGYQSRRAPYKTSFGMYFAMVADPDGNTILLSGDLAEQKVLEKE